MYITYSLSLYIEWCEFNVGLRYPLKDKVVLTNANYMIYVEMT